VVATAEAGAGGLAPRPSLYTQVSPFATLRVRYGHLWKERVVEPQLSGFALGLLFGAAKIGAIGTIGFAIAWWRTRRKLQRLERALPDPGVLDERLANLEQNSDYIGAKLAEFGETQIRLLQQLGSPPRLTEPPRREGEGTHSPITPH
jgi:hypothetical protein